MSAFRALSLAIVRGFLRDKASLFFALVFPLMFLVLFGGLLGDRSQSEVDLVQVGDVPVLDALSPEAAEAFEDTFAVTRTDDLDGALAQVRSGDADVAVVMEDDTLVAHFTLTDQVAAAVTQGALRAFVDGTSSASSSPSSPARPGRPRRTRCGCSRSRTTRSPRSSS